MMKACLASALALSTVLATFAVAPAQAEEPATAFRAVAPHAFTSEDLQRYGLSAADADRAIALQEQGYELKVLTPEEAASYTAGMTDTELLLVAILIGVVVIAVG
jgi:hypothetical protein